MDSKGRILSIQSHVAYGYVGGKSAVFPLQCLGYDVDVVNTVNFSNHSGYGRFGGTRTSGSELTTIFDHMKEVGLLRPSRLLTGYIPGGEPLSAIADLAADLRASVPSLIYLLDPVLGDSGKLYVSPEAVAVYQKMLPLADIITPNWFEVETLTGVQIHDQESLRRAFRILHEDYHVPHVVMSSIPLSKFEGGFPLPVQGGAEQVEHTETLLCVCSSANDSGVSSVHSCRVPALPGYFSGVGDLFSALVLAHFHADPPTDHTPLSYAVTQSLTATHAILTLTHEHAETLPADERTSTDEEQDAAHPVRKYQRMRGRELRLIQGQDIVRGTRQVQIRTMKPWTEFWS